MLFKKTHKLYLWIKTVVLISILASETIGNINKKRERGLFLDTETVSNEEEPAYEIRDINYVAIHLRENELRTVYPEDIYSYVFNECLYDFHPNICSSDILIKEFECFISIYHTQNRILIKNLAESTVRNSKCSPAGILQIATRGFSYSLPIVSFQIQHFGNTLNIILSHHGRKEQERKRNKTKKKLMQLLSRKKEELEGMVTFVKSVIYLMIYSCFYEKGLEIHSHIINNFAKNDNYSNETILADMELYIFFLGRKYMDSLNKIVEELELKLKQENECIAKHTIKQKEEKKKSYIDQIKKTNIIQILKTNLNAPKNRSYVAFFSAIGYELFYLHDTIKYIILFSDSSCQDEAYAEHLVDKLLSYVDNQIQTVRKEFEIICSPDGILSNKILKLRDKIYMYLFTAMNQHISSRVVEYIENLFGNKIKLHIESILYFDIKTRIDRIVKFFRDHRDSAIDKLKKIDPALVLKEIRDFPKDIFFNSTKNTFFKLASQVKKIIIVEENGKIAINEEEATIDNLNKIYAGYISYLEPSVFEITEKSCDYEFWDNPAFIHYNIPENYGVEEPKLYVIYKNSKNNKLYKKEIDNIIRNITRFLEATTYKDIESMDGKESEEISIDYLLKLEDEKSQGEFNIASYQL